MTLHNHFLQELKLFLCLLSNKPSFPRERHEGSLFGYVIGAAMVAGGAYLRFIKSACSMLASSLCSVVVSSQLLAALLWQTWASVNVQSPERRGSFHEILHLISQSWPQVPEIRRLAKLNAYSLYSPNCGNMWKWASNKWMLSFPAHPGTHRTANSQCRKE